MPHFDSVVRLQRQPGRHAGRVERIGYPGQRIAQHRPVQPFLDAEAADMTPVPRRIVAAAVREPQHRHRQPRRVAQADEEVAFLAARDRRPAEPAPFSLDAGDEILVARREGIAGDVGLAAGGEADITRYPFASRHEDFVAGVEAEGSRLGWTTVARGKEGDLFVSLRNPARLPMTMLWFSNGGRDYAPWNGRHVGCLGVEEGLNRAMLGDSLARIPNPLDAAGVPTGLTLEPDDTVEVRHVIGSAPWDGDGVIASVTAVDGGIVVKGADGTAATIPCDLAFLQL